MRNLLAVDVVRMNVYIYENKLSTVYIERLIYKTWKPAPRRSSKKMLVPEKYNALHFSESFGTERLFEYKLVLK